MCEELGTQTESVTKLLQNEAHLRLVRDGVDEVSGLDSRHHLLHEAGSLPSQARRTEWVKYLELGFGAGGGRGGRRRASGCGCLRSRT